MSKHISDEEIRTLLLFSNEYTAARERMEAAARLEQQYLAQLRIKYGLDDTWVCNDVLDGFVQMEAAA